MTTLKDLVRDFGIDIADYHLDEKERDDDYIEERLNDLMNHLSDLFERITE